jgi:hypothetical protein
MRRAKDDYERICASRVCVCLSVSLNVSVLMSASQCASVSVVCAAHLGGESMFTSMYFMSNACVSPYFGFQIII